MPERPPRVRGVHDALRELREDVMPDMHSAHLRRVPAASLRRLRHHLSWVQPQRLRGACLAMSGVFDNTLQELCCCLYRVQQGYVSQSSRHERTLSQVHRNFNSCGPSKCWCIMRTCVERRMSVVAEDSFVQQYWNEDLRKAWRR
jgi:hypothetical protein